MMVHRKMLALAAGARARIALTVALGLAISGTFVAQGVAVALVVSRILAGQPWTGALALVGVVALLAAASRAAAPVAGDELHAHRRGGEGGPAPAALPRASCPRPRVPGTDADGNGAVHPRGRRGSPGVLPGLLPAAVHRRGGRAPGRGGVHLRPQPPGGRARAGVRAGRSPGAAPVGRPAGRVRPAALAGVHGPQRPVRGQHAGNGHAEGAQRQRAPGAGPPERRARALPGDDGAARHLHDPQRRRGAGDERRRGDGRRRGRVPGGGRSAQPGGTPRGSVPHGGVLPPVGGVGRLLAHGLPGGVRLHGHLRAPGRNARGG